MGPLQSSRQGILFAGPFVHVSSRSFHIMTSCHLHYKPKKMITPFTMKTPITNNFPCFTQLGSVREETEALSDCKVLGLPCLHCLSPNILRTHYMPDPELAEILLMRCDEFHSDSPPPSPPTDKAVFSTRGNSETLTHPGDICQCLELFLLGVENAWAGRGP